MCLSNPKEFRVKGKYADKVLRYEDGRLYLTLQGDGDKLIKKGTWMDEKDFRYKDRKSDSISFEDSMDRYKIGFHLFTNKKVALNYAKTSSYYRCFIVEFKDLRAKGEQGRFWGDHGNCFNSIVVGKMKIVKEIIN